MILVQLFSISPWPKSSDCFWPNNFCQSDWSFMKRLPIGSMGLVYLDAWMVDFYAKYIIPTVDGSEILHQLRLVVYLQGFIHPRWLALGFLNRQQYGSSILRSFPFTIFTFGPWDLRQSFARLMSWFLGATGHPEQQIFAKKSVAQKISSPLKTNMTMEKHHY